MKVLKFGGTSVGSVENILKVKEIVESTGTNTIVVVSAMSGITDKLISTAKTAASGIDTYTTLFTEITERHIETIKATVPEQYISDATIGINALLSELKALYDKAFESKKLSESDLNAIVAYGEKMSSLFHRYRTAISLQEMSLGAGLGLTVIRGVAEAHGGALMLESRENAGTMVRISLSRDLGLESKLAEKLEPYAGSMDRLLTGLSPCLPLSCFEGQYFD